MTSYRTSFTNYHNKHLCTAQIALLMQDVGTVLKSLVWITLHSCLLEGIYILAVDKKHPLALFAKNYLKIIFIRLLSSRCVLHFPAYNLKTLIIWHAHAFVVLWEFLTTGMIQHYVDMLSHRSQTIMTSSKIRSSTFKHAGISVFINESDYRIVLLKQRNIRLPYMPFTCSKITHCWKRTLKWNYGIVARGDNQDSNENIDVRPYYFNTSIHGVHFMLMKWDLDFE